MIINMYDGQDLFRAVLCPAYRHIQPAVRKKMGYKITNRKTKVCNERLLSLKERRCKKPAFTTP